MTIFYAIVLGALQGVTEFLPISSSGHLLLAESFLGVKEASLAFDVALHLGTLLAVVISFQEEFLAMARALCRWGEFDSEAARLRGLALQLAVGTVPAVGAGLFFGDAIESDLRRPMVVAATLAGVGLLLLLGEKTGTRRRGFRTLSLLDAILVGVAQALAIVPGVSRSGITMTAGLFRGLNREAAVRFSFLLSAPVICGAGIYKIPDILRQGLVPGQAAFYVAGFVAAAISGYLVIAFLLRYVRTRTFDAFAYYRFGLAGLVLANRLLG